MAIHAATRPMRRTPNLRLRALRINRGLSLRELGRLTGHAGKTVGFAEAGLIPTPPVQHDIAAFFDLEPTDIWPVERQS